MNVSYSCRECERRVQVNVPADAREVRCPACDKALAVDPQMAFEGNVVGGPLQQCLICGCRELFVRKNFSQRLGVGIVVVGIIASTIAWGMHKGYISYGILFATALIDFVLYFSVGNLLQCYRCQAEYRGLSRLESFEPFDLETHEKFRQQAIRLQQK